MHTNVLFATRFNISQLQQTYCWQNIPQKPIQQKRFFSCLSVRKTAIINRLCECFQCFQKQFLDVPTSLTMLYGVQAKVTFSLKITLVFNLSIVSLKVIGKSMMYRTYVLSEYQVVLRKSKMRVQRPKKIKIIHNFILNIHRSYCRYVFNRLLLNKLKYIIQGCKKNNCMCWFLNLKNHFIYIIKQTFYRQ